MNDRKLKNLFEQARKEPSPRPTDGFEQNVIRALNRAETKVIEEPSLWDQLGQMFPRMAVATLLIIGICMAAEFYGPNSASLTSEAGQFTDQWFFADGEN
ncbi:hypothetical protein [Pedosphaera parvula]|uniref:Uncharacterized protein n=1 Tax=Pedosphaera parvula (strain Ellin514) TaxID=320771 RepID=B9XJZ9_PEDPL|nr:hypothetical protein [Pedosphaera parvula]EEF59822.1 hypothetical protein Cflav_PD2829 [Pedosphaera parvula Ellin514]